MKIIIDIPEKTNAHIRSDYGHGMKCLFEEDKEILCDAIYHYTPYEERSHGEWKKDGFFAICSECGHELQYYEYVVSKLNFCPNCGTDMRGETNG